MRIKKKTWILTFESTTQAMAAEKFCMEQNLPGRLIPIPREITAGCGLSWKAVPEEETRFLRHWRKQAVTGRGVYTGIVEKSERQLFSSFTSLNSDC